MMEADTHKFGFHDDITAQNYQLGTTLRLKVLSFLGRQFNDLEETERSGYLKVLTPEATESRLRLNQTMEDVLRIKHGIKDYPELVGKYITIKSATRGRFAFWEVVGFDSGGTKPLKG